MYTARTTRIISKLWNFSLLTLSGVKPSVSGTDQTDDMPISCKTLDMHTTTSTERREKIKPHKLMLYGYLQTKCKFYSMIMYSKDNSCGWCWMFGALSHSRKKKTNAHYIWHFANWRSLKHNPESHFVSLSVSHSWFYVHIFVVVCRRRRLFHTLSPQSIQCKKNIAYSPFM